MKPIKKPYHRMYRMRSTLTSTGVVPHNAISTNISHNKYCDSPVAATPFALSSTRVDFSVLAHDHTNTAPITGSRNNTNCRNIDSSVSQNGLQAQSMKMG